MPAIGRGWRGGLLPDRSAPAEAEAWVDRLGLVYLVHVEPESESPHQISAFVAAVPAAVTVREWGALGERTETPRGPGQRILGARRTTVRNNEERGVARGERLSR
jgi:hypothetical protein